jgi:PleD family two-component response regulator
MCSTVHTAAGLLITMSSSAYDKQRFRLIECLFKTQCRLRINERVNMTISPPDLLDASILIVDGQEANTSLLERVLRDAGHQRITSTTNPLDVCPLHRTHCYDLIVLDISTPDMDGFAVMSDLKVGAVEEYLPVLVLITQPTQMLRALEAGARDFISKPFELVEVRTRIRNMLEIRLLYKKIALYN